MKHPALTLLCMMLASAITCPHAYADGCILGKKGYISEREQAAFIEWKDGQERLWVATRSDVTTDPTVWIVPVLAKPEQVKAEPVEVFPYVRGENQLRLLRKYLADTQEDVLWRNGCFLPAFLFLRSEKSVGTFAGVASVNPSGVDVHSQVEKHGMVVQVLTARTTDALDTYLRGLKLDAKADQLHSLKTYIGQEHSLICAWRSQAKSTARAVRIDFPSPHIFYPMLPTRAYSHEVRTSIFVRGWVRRVPAVRQPGVRGEHGLWRVRESALEYAPISTSSFVKESHEEEAKDDEPLEPLTRVFVPTRPSDWETDLALEPYATAASVDTVIFLTKHRHWLSLVLNGSLGILLGLCLPWLLIAGDQRRWQDWLVLGVLGGSIYFSAFVLAIGLLVWCCLRFPHSRWTVQATVNQVGLLLMGVVSLFFIGVALEYNRTDAVRILAIAVGLLAVPVILLVPLISAGGCAWRAFHTRAGWLIVFLVLHGALVVMSCEAMLAWLP